VEKFILRSLFILSVLTLTSCGGVVEDVSGIDSNTIVTSSFSEYSSSSISGSGTIRFIEALPVSSSKALALKASLDQTISMSSVTAVFYSSNGTIPSTSGIAVKFTRNGAGVTAEVIYNGTSLQVTSSKMSFYFPTSLDVIIEVHNINPKARVLVWRRNFVEYSVTTADIDSSRSGDLSGSVPVTTGGGSFAGLIIQNSTVTAARLETQKVLD